MNSDGGLRRPTPTRDTAMSHLASPAFCPKCRTKLPGASTSFCLHCRCAIGRGSISNVVCRQCNSAIPRAHAGRCPTCHTPVATG
jgi:hypothetical protein